MKLKLKEQSERETELEGCEGNRQKTIYNTAQNKRRKQQEVI